MRISGYVLASYLLASYIVVSYLATSYMTVVTARSRTTLGRMVHELHRLRDTACRSDPWHLPGKQETCVEWLREIHGTRDWCVKAAQ